MPPRARLLSRSTALSLIAATALTGCPDGTANVTADAPDTTTSGGGATGTATEPTTGAPTTGTTSTTTAGPTSTGTSTTGDSDTSAVTTTRGETTTASTTGETTGDTTTGTTTGTTGTTTGDMTGDTTGDTTTGDEPVTLSGHDWLHYITGYSSLEPLFAEKLPNGQVFVTGGGGLYGRYVTLATGEPEEITYDLDGIGSFAEWLDETDGSRVHSRMLTTTKSPMGTYGFSNAITHAPGGDIVVAGYWWGENYFNHDTPYQSVMKSESLIINNQYHRAEDPFFTRMDGAGAPLWLHRGRTPGPLNTTWFNQPRGIVALPDGDFLTTADYERPGFVAFHGTAGAKTMTGTNSAYMARLGADGVPKWVLECAGNFVRGRGLAAGPGGVVYALTYENMVLFKGTPDELTIPKEADDDDTKWMFPLVRVDPAGKPTWVRRLVGIGGSFTPAVVVRDDDSAVIVAQLNGELQIRDGQDIAGSLTTQQSDVVIARIAPDGGLAWIRALGLKSGNVIAASGGEVWIAGTLPGTATTIKLDEQEVPLPALQFDTELDIRVLLRISADGAATEARVVGAGLPSEYLSSDGLSLLLTGTYHCDMAVPLLFDEGGVGVPMASACDQADTKAYRGYVLSVKI
jgi:hypothetical protein